MDRRTTPTTAPPRPRSRYEMGYRGSFVFPVTPEEVWADISRVDRYERWWRWLRDVHADEGFRRGGTLYGTVVPPLPYRMRVAVHLRECVAPRLVRAEVDGDLAGPARLDLAPAGDGATRATVAWRLEMRKPAMRAAARVARPALRWGHDRVVDAAVAGYRRRLRR